MKSSVRNILACLGVAVFVGAVGLLPVASAAGPLAVVRLRQAAQCPSTEAEFEPQRGCQCSGEDLAVAGEGSLLDSAARCFSDSLEKKLSSGQDPNALRHSTGSGRDLSWSATDLAYGCALQAAWSIVLNRGMGRTFVCNGKEGERDTLAASETWLLLARNIDPRLVTFSYPGTKAYRAFLHTPADLACRYVNSLLTYSSDSAGGHERVRPEVQKMLEPAKAALKLLLSRGGEIRNPAEAKLCLAELR